MTNGNVELTADWTMSRVEAEYPGARRALFRAYHIGGCSSCGFQAEETLGEVCGRQDPVVEAGAAVRTILEGHEFEKMLWIGPEELKARLDGGEPVMLVDIRSRQEHEAVALPGSALLTPEISQLLCADGGGPVVLIDHKGVRVLDAVSYFIGHGKKDIVGLRGGIDGWAEQVDPAMPRYELE